MNQNMLYLIIGALVVVAGVLGYQVYQSNQQPDKIGISVGEGGISIQTE